MTTPLPPVSIRLMSFRNYMDAIEHLYDINILHGTPEVYEVNHRQLNGEYDIAFKLNLQSLSDSTICGVQKWENLKKDALEMDLWGRRLSSAGRQTLHNLKAAQRAQGDLKPLRLHLDAPRSSETR